MPRGLRRDSGIDAPALFGAPLLWLRKGAEQGNSLSQDSLGFLYETGKGVPQDYVQAHMWYNLAASDTQDVIARRPRCAISGRQDDARSDRRGAENGAGVGSKEMSVEGPPLEFALLAGRQDYRACPWSFDRFPARRPDLSGPISP